VKKSNFSFLELVQHSNQQQITSPTLEQLWTDHQSCSLNLKILLDDFEVIQSFSYTQVNLNEEKILLAYLSFKLIGMHIENASLLSHSNFYQDLKHDLAFIEYYQSDDIPVVSKTFVLVREMISEYLGQRIFNIKTEHLICRCFNTTRENLKDIVSKHNVKTYAELSAHSQAGLGCRSCLNEVKSFLPQEVLRKPKLYLEKTHANWILDISRVLEFHQINLEIKSFDQGVLILAGDTSLKDNEIEYNKNLKNLLDQDLDADLVVFLDFSI
jgi:bacterioferritin-associated ferredoxin